MSKPRPGSWALFRQGGPRGTPRIALVQRSSDDTVYFTGKTIIKSAPLKDVISTYGSAGEAERDRKVLAGESA